MERLTKRKEDGSAILAINCPEGCEHATCSMEEGYQCKHQCEADIIGRLADYEEAEDAGLLLRLPVAVGSTVYHYCGDFGVILPYTVSSICISSFISGGIDIVIEGGAYGEDEVLDDFSESLSDFQKSFFLTESEAEQALKQMGE